MGATAGDVDGDGDADLVVTGLEGTFCTEAKATDYTDSSFQADNCASSTFVDFDLDGDLICTFVGTPISLSLEQECRDAAGRLEFVDPRRIHARLVVREHR